MRDTSALVYRIVWDSGSGLPNFKIFEIITFVIEFLYVSWILNHINRH